MKSRSPRIFLLLLWPSIFLRETMAFPREPDYSDQMNQNFWHRMGEADLTQALKRKTNEGTAKNVIFFVGDGMGPNTITASRIYKGGETSQLEFDKFDSVGLIKTYSTDKTVPDSAATATALFGGVKTNNEVAGLDGGVLPKDCTSSLKKERRVSSLMDWAQEAGKDTGFVTTTRVTHATPSALYSHSAYRKWECDATMPQSAALCKDIARQLIEDLPGRNLKVIMGGGMQCLTWNISNSTDNPIDQWACKRNDGRDLVKEWEKDKAERKLSFKVVTTAQELSELNHNKTDSVLGIFANGHMSYESSRNKSPKGQPSLKDMVSAAIKILRKNQKGFVLVVEGGLIDYAHHRGMARRALEETVMFNEAVAEALRLTGDNDTLIVVTSDHSHNLNINGYVTTRNDILGIAMNSEIDGIPFTILTYSTGSPINYQYEFTPNGKIQRKDPTTSNISSYDYHQQAGILTEEATHGGVDVPIYATGPMAHLFHGVHEQSYVAHVVAYASKVGRYANRADVHRPCDKPSGHSGAESSQAPRRAVAVALFLYLYLFRL